jgi:anion-transporting  ArsA/GET3 family ATPase
VVDCNPESLSQLCDQLRSVKGIELYSYLLDTIRQYPYKLDEEADLVLTTAEHAEYLETILPDRKKLARVAIRLAPQSLAGMVRLRSGERVGLLTCSSRFGDMLFNACKSYARNVAVSQPCLFDQTEDLNKLFSEKDAVLVPMHYEKYCSEEVARFLSSMEKKGKVISCAYEMDEGSALYLEEKLQQLRQSKQV